MGNHRFRLSDMMPNAWFYKLRDMSKVRGHNNPSHPAKKSMQASAPNHPRKSFYYTPESVRMDTKLCLSPRNPKFSDSRFPHEPPRKSTRKRAKRRTVYMPSPRKIAPSEGDFPAWLKPDGINDGSNSPDREDISESSLSGFECENSLDGRDQSYLSSCSCKLSSSASDIIIDVDDTSYHAIHVDSLTEFDMISEPDLPPIQTKPGKPHTVFPEKSRTFHDTSIEYPTEKPKRSRRSSTSPGSRKSFSGGVKLRGNGRKLGLHRKNAEEEKKKKKGMMFYSESFAIVKASVDPERDFKESMMEMIVENDIKEAKDLEELLACYLSLNSNQYHDLIIKAFEQIWFNMAKALHFN